MERIIFVTGNINKANEIRERFSKENIEISVESMDFNELEINDIELISKDKAKQAYDFFKQPVFVIDSGFNIYAYPNNPGYPGAYVRRSGISENIDLLLETMKDVSNRKCKFLDCLTFYDGSDYYFFYGSDEGTLTYEKRGNESPFMRSKLWYVFIPNGFDKTLAEMTDEERNRRKDKHISAKEQFINWYKSEYHKHKVKEKTYI